MPLQVVRGCLALIGPDVDSLAEQVSQYSRIASWSFEPTADTYHITLLSITELRSLGPASFDQIIQQIQQDLDPDRDIVHSLGLGGHPRPKPDVFFVVILWAKGQLLRKKLGLPPKHFHITLSRNDVHDVDKGVSSLLSGELPARSSADLLDCLVYTLYLMREHASAEAYAVKLCAAHPRSEKGFIRLGDMALRTGKHKLAMLAFACAYERCALGHKARDYCVQKITTCAHSTEWGQVFREQDEIAQLPSNLKDALLEPWPVKLRSSLRHSDPVVEYGVPTLCIEPREQLHVPMSPRQRSEYHFYKLPRFFRWLVPFHLAIMSTPRSGSDIAVLASPHLGIRHVLTLTEETPLQPEWFSRTRVKNTFIPIPNYSPPSLEQMSLIIRLLQSEENIPMLIHCGGGKGRAGTVAACYIAAFGFGEPLIDRSQTAMTAEEAISTLRTIRPGSIETSQQEDFVRKWCSKIWKDQSVFPPLVPEPPPCGLEIEGRLDPSSNFFVFVGLPGSGKSWVARAVLSRDPGGWIWISQDETGSRAMCENEVSHARSKGRVILDRCNTSKDDRKSWLALAAHWAVGPVCVWFDYERALCTYRAQTRAGHPTLQPGRRVLNAVDQMHKSFKPPTQEEGFSSIIRVRSFAAAEEFIQRFSPPTALFKFPRTPHLLNLGAATDDDLIAGAPGAPIGIDVYDPVTVTEKVDGANMGFSLSADRSKIVVQNRSHYVNSASHAQFKKLDAWVEDHRAELYSVLDRDPYFAQRYVLFGEWLAATHSVSYTKLPDRFLAFDLYDRSTDTWASTAVLSGLLAGTNLRMVPILHEGKMPSAEELKMMVQRKSLYCEDRVEGVYIKVERGDRVVNRGKVVRADFIAGNEHWTRGMIRMNDVVIERDDL